MIYLSHRARFATGLLVACSVLLGASSPHSKSNAQKRIGTSYVWRPSREAMLALKGAMSTGDCTKQSLLRIMRNNHASLESISFASSFSTEAAYLSTSEPYSPEGLSVGEVTYPFRKTATKTYVILNGKPRIIDVSDSKFLSHINIATSKDFKTLWGSSMKADPLWREPQGYNVQPGMYRNAASTDVEVVYPVKDLGSGKIIGFAYVVFQFGGPGWELSDTRLEMITDAAHTYFGASK